MMDLRQAAAEYRQLAEASEVPLSSVWRALADLAEHLAEREDRPLPHRISHD